jgi:hypothetical protein
MLCSSSLAKDASRQDKVATKANKTKVFDDDESSRAAARGSLTSPKREPKYRKVSLSLLLS